MSSAVSLDDRKVHDAVAAVPGIAALLVFGSRARGIARADSDVAVLPAAEHGSAAGSSRGGRVVDQHALSSRLSALEGYLAELRAAGLVRFLGE